jgi:hypothetical protein
VPATNSIVLAGSLLLLAGCVGGCGNSRTQVPSATLPSPPAGVRTLTLHEAGVRLAVPINWTVSGQRAPLQVTIASGAAVMAVWRFARAAPVPVGAPALTALRARLLGAMRARDPTVRVLRAIGLRVAGARAIEVEAVERIAGLSRQVSSTHVYFRHEELVLDQYAPPALFAAVDRSVFTPVRRSLVLVRAGTA